MYIRVQNTRYRSELGAIIAVKGTDFLGMERSKKWRGERKGQLRPLKTTKVSQRGDPKKAKKVINS